jgi:GntR family transcriptional regulator
MIKVDESSGVPIYLQVVNGMKKEILSGVYGPDDRLPSIRDLAIEQKVNPNTIAKAYQEMESLGLIYFKRGQGAFVAPRTSEERMKEAKSEMNKLIAELLEIAHSLGISHEDLLSLLREHMSAQKNTK